MFTKFYDRLDLSRAHLDDILTAPANRAKALDLARELHLPRQSLTRATTRMGFWIYVFQLGADVQLGTVTLAGAQPGPQNVVTLPVRQLDHYTTPGMPLTELAGLLAAVAEDYPPSTLTALLADSLTKVLDLWADARRNRRPTIDIRDLDRAVTSEFPPPPSTAGAPATTSHHPAWPARPGPTPYPTRGEQPCPSTTPPPQRRARSTKNSTGSTSNTPRRRTPCSGCGRAAGASWRAT